MTRGYENIANFNAEKRDEISEELERIKCQMQALLGEARELVRNEWPSEIDHAEAYVFGHLAENLDAANPYNSSFQSMIEELTCAGLDEQPEPIEDFGESWRDDE